MSALVFKHLVQRIVNINTAIRIFLEPILELIQRSFATALYAKHRGQLLNAKRRASNLTYAIGVQQILRELDVLKYPALWGISWQRLDVLLHQGLQVLGNGFERRAVLDTVQCFAVAVHEVKEWLGSLWVICKVLGDTLHLQIASVLHVLEALNQVVDQ